MKVILTKLYLFVGCMLLLVGCGHKSSSVNTDLASGPFKYATLLKETTDKADTVLSVADPWKKGAVLQSWKMGKYGNYRVPKRVIVFTTSHCQMMEYLKCADRIVGVCDAQYIHIADIQKRLKLKNGVRGKIVDCGNSMSPDIERIISLKPDAIIVSPYEGMNLGRLTKLGVPIIFGADYMETSALGRAEWIRYYGMLLGCGPVADEFFDEVEKQYLALKKQAASTLKQGRSIITERKTGAIWYTPGGKSSIGSLLRDANAGYAFSDDKHSGSLALSAEQMLARAGQSDVWAFKVNGKLMSKADLLSEYHGYEMLKAFKTGEIYECDCDKVPYFEEVSWHPDFLLREMIQLTHPTMDLGGLRYYSKL